MSLRDLDFLRLFYSGYEILINRLHISASDSDLTSIPSPSSNPYLTRYIVFSDTPLLCFDLDYWLCESFSLKQTKEVKLAIIVSTQIFTKQNLTALQRIISESEISYSPKFIAFFVTNNSSITRIPLPSLKLFPFLLRQHCQIFGFYTCRFTNNSTIQYHLDLNSILKLLLNQGAQA